MERGGRGDLSEVCLRDGLVGCGDSWRWECGGGGVGVTGLRFLAGTTKRKGPSLDRRGVIMREISNTSSGSGMWH